MVISGWFPYDYITRQYMKEDTFEDELFNYYKDQLANPNPPEVKALLIDSVWVSQF